VLVFEDGKGAIIKKPELVSFNGLEEQVFTFGSYKGASDDRRRCIIFVVEDSDAVGRPRDQKNWGAIGGLGVWHAVALEPIGDSLVESRRVFAGALGRVNGGVLPRAEKTPHIIGFA
jgi:hypothetical protein